MKNLTNICLFLFIAVFLASCGNDKDSGNAAPPALKSNETTGVEEAPSANEIQGGEYECYEGYTDAGYLYHKLVLSTTNGNVNGTLFSGYYMNKTDQGYYTMPTGTITSEVAGNMSEKNQVKLYLGAVQDSIRDEGQMPDQQKMFKQGDKTAVLYRSGENYLWIINNDTLVFEKAPAIEAE